MSTRCVNCGYPNRTGAKFCANCGTALPTAPVSQSTPRPIVPAPQQHPLQSQPQPQPPPAPQQRKSSFQQLFNPDPVLQGTVLQDPIERFEDPPVDWGRVLLILSMIAIFVIPFLLQPQALAQLFWMFVIIAAIFFLPMMLASMMGFKFMMPLLNPITWFSLGSSIGSSLAPRNQSQRREVPHYSFKVEDAGTQQTVGVMMVGRRKGGDISLGDEVQVWGKLDRAHNVLLAHKVLVEQSMNRPAGYKVSAAKGIPLWLGPALAAIILVLLLLSTL